MGSIIAFLLCFSAVAEAPAPSPLVRFDLAACIDSLPADHVLRYDAMKLVASLQGLANRDKPRLVVRYLEAGGAGGKTINIDDYWLDYARKAWLKDAPVTAEKDLAGLLRRFSECCSGLVLWDPAVPATSNVAATVCGVEGWLPVRSGSPLLAVLAAAGVLPPVKLDLTGRFTGAESGSAKCDAYLWAMREYLNPDKCRVAEAAGCSAGRQGGGKCHPSLMAYYVDAFTQRPSEPGVQYPDLANATVINHDYFIAQKAFFLDLSPWGDETPVDDPGQPLGTDKKTMETLLRAQYEQNRGGAFTSVGGFIAWNQKYTNHGNAGGKHEPVPTEWEYAAILSAHNALMDADALGLVCMPNASAWRHFPLQSHYAQNPKPAPRKLEDKTYILSYMGDYDSAAWLSSSIPRIWDDPARGSLPIAWAFNPNLSDRAPQVFDYVYATKTANDWFIGGDSGAGYINPNLLVGKRLGSGLPDALDLWVEHNQRYYQRFDYSITGFVINGFHGDMPLRIQEAYAKFSPDGVGMQLGFDKPLMNNTPFLRHVSDIYPDGGDLKKAAAQMAMFAKKSPPRFLIFRWILQSAGTLKSVHDLMQQEYPELNVEFCDPYTFFDLYRQSLAK